MDLAITGKVALVIASSQGLGKAIAAQLVKEGARVMITSRSEESLQEVQKELQELNAGEINYFPADVTKPEEIKALVQKTIDVYGGSIDILLNNSGGPTSGSFEELKDEDWENAFQLTLLNYVRVTREVLPYMKEKGGKIVNIASSSIKQPLPNLLLSNAFRLGIVGLSKTLAEELAPYNILVNTVAPGRIATNRLQSLDEKTAEKQHISVEEATKQSEAKIPLGRYGTPEEFAKVVTFLLSDVNSYVTGTSLLIDGGMVKSI